MKIRIVNLDFYMSTPIPSLDVIYSDFRGSSVNHVPVIRIFGSTEAGHKICLHVHGVFPYIYIPYDSQTPAEGFLYQIASGLDKAINLSLGQTSSNIQHIYKVSLVSGIPFYGYHARKHQFLKLYFYNPLIIKKACLLLQNGSILGKIYQPNESHIPYILQFMIDYNLHGMSFIYLKDLKYRVDPNCPNEYPENTILPITISKMSVCKVEADTQADCILNRDEITPGKLTVNPGIKAIWDDEKQRQRNNNDSSQIDHCLTQNRVDIPPTATHVAYRNVLAEKLKSKPRNEQSPALELSVYPAETPSTADVINASIIENHTCSQSTDNSGLDDTITPNLNMTDVDESALDEDGQVLYDILQDLRQDNVEKDSILSQVQRDAESEEEEEEEADLSLPLHTLQTPRKIDESSAQIRNEFWKDSYFDALAHIPQLDGTYDEETGTKRKKKKKFKLTDDPEAEMIEVAASRRVTNNNQQGIDDPRLSAKSDRKLKRKKPSEEDKNSTNVQHFAVNQYRYLDGPNDSSSENEDSERPLKKRKCRQVRKAFAQSAKYNPLKVQYGSPTKNFQATENNSNLQNPLYRPSISSAKEDLSNPSVEKKDQQKHRRKLNFSEMSSQNYTKIEENLVCRYKSDKKLSDKIQTIHTPSCTENEQVLISSYTSSENMDEVNKFPNISVHSTCHEDVDILTESVNNSSNIVKINQINHNQNNVNLSKSNILTVSEKCYEDLSISQIVPYQEIKNNKTKSVATVSQTSTGSGSISDDLFSPDYLHASFSSAFLLSGTTNKEMDNLNEDPAELYDAKNKFVPQASTSKLNKTLTQCSVESNDAKTSIQLSLESKETEVSLSAENQFDVKSITSNISDKTSMKVITPYQKDIPYLNETNFVNNSTSNENCNKSSASVISPYQNEHSRVRSGHDLTSYLTVCESFIQCTPIKGEPCIIVPKYNPPSRSLIESTFSEYNIPEVHHQQPFYSDVNHVTGAMEVGVRILKIPSNNIVDMPEFENNYVGLNHYRKLALEEMYPNEKITNKDINNYKLSLCKDTECLITTVRLPPSRAELELWLKDRLVKKYKPKKSLERKKIIIPCSPGGNNDESDDSLTISPCTPVDNTLANNEVNDGDNETFKSSFKDNSTNGSPIIKKSEVLKRRRKRLIEKPKLKETNNFSNDSDRSINTSLSISKLNVAKNNSHQITGVTLDTTNNFAMSCDNLQNAKAICEYLHLTVMCMELIVETRCDRNPNPSLDSIKGIVYKIFNDVPENHTSKRAITGCLLINSIVKSPSKVKFSILDGISVNNNSIKVTDSEEDLLYQFTALVIECDPDILVGYEIEMLSWGYLIERGYILNLNLVSLLSRIPIAAKKKNEDNSDLIIPGRIILDFWRLLRHEVALQSYTFENIVYHILHQRVPFYSFKNITYWWSHPSALYRDKVLKYYYFRVESVLKIMDQLDLIGRTSELAKLFGIQFFEVLSRGSQFRVESMMLRLAKPLNYIPVSPSVQQRAKMRAPESLPLIMEPESKFYPDPVIVLDFQSLYPSMIIAYNYCFSTCLGRIEHLGGDVPFEFGATQLKVSRKRVKSLHRRDLINISPVGIAYVKKSVREGILPRMLQEILDTRLMVKKSLKQNAGNKTLGKILDARQLGLKLIANVTYGYTAANFSGRMPCIEVGDSVVSKGRETLQRAINLIEKSAKWNAKVVYGDTDSMFVLVAGRSREEAFRIGAEIAEAVTNDNPSPVKLKLEKVFHPCILQTKKRYVGYMYESPEQNEPEYCAKGIETVRRDGCPAVAKMLEKCLKISFDTRNVSLVRQYVTRQFSKILSGRISIQDLTFAKEYRGSSNYRPGACVPALELARKWMATDKRSEPRRGERVPYVIINGPPGLPLIRLVRSPREVIADPSLRLNSLYYITKVIIPPINRCFLLIGADLNNWFNDMPRKNFQYLHTSSPVKGKKSTISQYFSAKNCAVCGQQSQEGLCQTCLEKPQVTSISLHEKVRILEKNYYETKMICQSCCGILDKISCISLDCPVYYRRIQTEKDIQQTPFIRQLVSILPDLDF